MTGERPSVHAPVAAVQTAFAPLPLNTAEVTSLTPSQKTLVHVTRLSSLQNVRYMSICTTYVINVETEDTPRHKLQALTRQRLGVFPPVRQHVLVQHWPNQALSTRTPVILPRHVHCTQHDTQACTSAYTGTSALHVHVEPKAFTGLPLIRE